jgi:hypothetical protein
MTTQEMDIYVHLSSQKFQTYLHHNNWEWSSSKSVLWKNNYKESHQKNKNLLKYEDYLDNLNKKLKN